MDTNTNSGVRAPSTEEALSMLDDLALEDGEFEAAAEEDAFDDVIEEDTIEEEPEEVVETVAAGPQVIGELDLDDALEADLARTELYEEQESTSEVNTELAETPAKSPEKAAGKVRAPREASAAPKTVRDLSALPSPAFFLTEADASADDHEASKAAVIASTPTQKKIAEKFENVIASLNAGRLPSVYVVSAFKILDEKKTVTSNEMVAAFKAMKYSDGTARSQVGQIISLFHTLKIGTRIKNSLQLREDSLYAKSLRDLIAKR